jgi:hypothetical protein
LAIAYRALSDGHRGRRDACGTIPALTIPVDRRPAVARAKSTARAESRRRNRAARAAAGLDPQEPIETVAPEPVPEARPRLFTMPDVRGDLRALPSLFRTQRLLLLPPLLIVVGFVLAMAQPQLTDPTANFWASRAAEILFVPYGLLPFFLAGFIAPRAAYLIGFLLGALNAVLLLVYIATHPVPGADVVGQAAGLAFVAFLSGGIFAGFAAWYRRFLRGTQERSRAARAQREAQKAREEREARRGSRQAAR